MRGSEAADLVFGATPAAVADTIERRAREVIAPPELRALDKQTGATIHSVHLEVPPTGSPMTYLLDGRQFIVMAYGTGSATGLIGLVLSENSIDLPASRIWTRGRCGGRSRSDDAAPCL